LAPDAEPVEDTAVEPPAQAAAEEISAPAEAPAESPPTTQSLLPSVDFASAEAAPASTEAVPATAAEPEMVEVWRPGRPQGERRPRDAERRGGRRRHERPATPAEGQTTGEGATAAAVDGQAVAADATPPADGERKERHGRPRHRRRDRGPRKDADGKVAEGQTVEAKSNESKPGEEQRADRPQRQARPERRPERGDRPPRQDRGDRGPRRDRDRGDDNRQARSWSSDQPSRSNKEPDPNSPFAKLLALKEQLQGNKDRS
jgi:ATP-dependent RNA helicase SUPV3L1/SUV3